MESEILAKAIRGETVESVHRGHLIVVSGAGRTLYSLGDPETVTFWRSSAKSFQAIPFLTSGAAERFGFSEREIALACGSHSGERVHVETAAEMLERIGLGEADLHCGAHVPFDEKRAEEMIKSGEQPTQLHNNCSGKHAAMLAFAKHAGADLKTYEHLENPVQQQILDCVVQFSDVPRDAIKSALTAAPRRISPCRFPQWQRVSLGSFSRRKVSTRKREKRVGALCRRPSPARK